MPDVRRKFMKHSVIILAFLIAFCTLANSQNLTDKQQLTQIKKTIKEQYTSWVIFSNGTYLVITADSATPDLRTRAIQILKDTGTAEGKNLRKIILFWISKILMGGLWIVPFQGLYTYVSTTELKNNGVPNPTDQDIVLFAMAKRQKDIIEYKIVETSY